VIVNLLGRAQEIIDRALLTGALVRPLQGPRWMYGLIDLMPRAHTPFRNRDGLVRANAWSSGILPASLEAFRQDTRVVSAGAFSHVMQANLSFRLPGNLSAVAAPALVLAGEREYGLMRRSARELAAALSHPRAAVVQGAVHNWPLQEPALFAHTRDAWFRPSPLPGRLIDIAPNGRG
jgi:pimeloyl-ACP methyl ester carboxylesterase